MKILTKNPQFNKSQNIISNIAISLPQNDALHLGEVAKPEGVKAQPPAWGGQADGCKENYMQRIQIVKLTVRFTRKGWAKINLHE